MEFAIAVCADCDAKNPQWASINRGVFICDECNSIHRQLGRHISHTKHLSKSLWRPSQLFMVQYLALAGANRFWEHVLLEPLLNKRCESSKLHAVVDKKPQPDSPLHPTKADFIRKKYLFHGFFKLPSVIHSDDLNQQLHASVRTAVLETSLYLLALGANPNYIHPVKGTSPVHVACQYEQVGQLELLIAYGGDVCIQSDKGITPLEIALEKVQRSQQQQQQPDATLATEHPQPQAPWSPLIDCLVSAFYELTDGLSFYLCRRVPNHKAAIFFATPLSGGLKNGTAEIEEGQGKSGGPFKAFYGPGHFLTAPKSVKESNGTLEGEANRQADARAKVCALDNAAFEDLCIDVYDEAERRLTNSFLEPTVEASDASARLPPPSGGSGGAGGRPHSMTATSGVGGHPQGVATTTTRPSSLILFFLPPNTAYTSVRNQARQKLGRLSMTAFRALVVDVLHEAARRLVPLLESSSLPLAVVRPKMRHHEYTIYGGADGGGRVAVDNDDEVLMLVGGGDVGSCGARNRATNTASTSVDDPVYDQVAVETEVGVMTRASVSTSHTAATASIAMSATSLTSPTMDVFTESSKLDHLQESKEQKQPGEESAATTTTSSTMDSDASPSRIASSSSSPVIIESRPGNLPGSRRLHLAATGRLASHRASVPAPNHCPSFDGLHKSLASTTATIAAPSSVISAESTFDGSLERCAAPTMLQQSLEAFVPVCAIQRPPMLSAEVQTSALCCAVAADAAVAEAAEEMRRLREEREEATQQLAATTARLRELELACERLTEENNALKAAFSAGMVKTHEATRSSPATGSHDNPPKSMKTDADHNSEETKVSAVSTKETSGELNDVSEEEEGEEDDDEEYNNEDVHHHSKSVSHRSGSGGINGSGNYAVGSQCLDSGMLLRQGISLWARSSPPADVVEVVPMVVTTAPSGTTVTAAVAVAPTPPQPSSSAAANTRSYVNLQNPRPSTARTPLGKQHQPTASTGGGASAVGGSDDTEASDDYTAPNETGTPSPAPVLSPASRSSAGGGRGGMMLRAPPTQFAASGVHRSGEVLLEYSVPAQVTGDDGSHLKKAVPITSTPTPTASSWKHPPYERIVRGVECIIVRIRALLDAANGRRIHEKARSSQLIQAAVQDLVVLFPPISKCHPTVGAALTSLMANSQKLRLHCEAIANAAVATEPSTGASTSSSCNSSQLITFAHEIASAAKTVLNFFQAERH